MTQSKESVVTPERFDSGMTWEAWMAHVKRNIPKFEYNYAATSVPGDKASVLKELAQKENGPVRVLALGEDWCPDVFRGAGVLQRMAEAAGWDLRFFPRDDNKDIMQEFLKNGQHESIPTVVFYTKDNRYITHWIERPAKADTELGQIQELFEGLDREKDHIEMRRRYDEFQQGPVWGSWRDATIDEITALLQEKCA
ncbi:MAG: thioredoxin family protein [Dehalococcoidia bacterium]